jgi:FKBP-type peptidyl-prolyl cis-trans isomerase FkpA
MIALRRNQQFFHLKEDAMIRRTMFLAMLCLSAASMSQAAGQATAAAPAAAAADPLVKIDNVVGTGKEASTGSTVVVNYTGWYYKPMGVRQRGRQFDSSLDAGREPLVFQLGAGKVIKGWDQGVVGMKVGGKRTLIIPSELAYGKRGAGGGSIPPDSDLIFDVELLDVK